MHPILLRENGKEEALNGNPKELYTDYLLSISLLDEMKKANVASLEKLMTEFKALGGRIIACEMTMEVMGISRSDLDENLIDEFGAVGMYVNESKKAQMTLFI